MNLDDHPLTPSSRRPGAGPDGYAMLKKHHFFKRTEWSSLRAQTPPKLALNRGGQSSKGKDLHDTSRTPSHVRASSTRQNDRNAGTSLQTESPGRIYMNLPLLSPSTRNDKTRKRIYLQHGRSWWLRQGTIVPL
ncbi:hypothetical protein F3Y22_tig00016004pilonHSYRG00012 [Hibiscus syriacus]|uniref:Uncharacterized protein n=1 Tax=Hibiscus syriacus TaxID=106335 RepID=A0A6A3C007_HIBSY|nr:hypothetical protein F3Y22_tig00016004pilonHSYRG00012 [Hibiscus syriacus]